jgi:hypothetical protein
MLVCYNIPNTWTATRSAESPADLQRRSNLANGICGEGSDRMCPGSAVPQFRNNNHKPDGGSAFLDSEESRGPPYAGPPSMVPLPFNWLGVIGVSMANLPSYLLAG